MKVLYFKRERHLPDGQINLAHCFYIQDKEKLLVSESPVEPVGPGKAPYEHPKWKKFSVQTPDEHEAFRWMEAMAIAEGKKPLDLPGVTISGRETFDYEEARIDELIADTPSWKEHGEKVPLEFDALIGRVYGQQNG